MPSALAQRAGGYKPNNGSYFRTVSQRRALMHLLAYVLIAVLFVVSFPVAMAGVWNANRMLIPIDFRLHRVMSGGCLRAVPYGPHDALPGDNCVRLPRRNPPSCNVSTSRAAAAQEDHLPRRWVHTRYVVLVDSYGVLCSHVSPGLALGVLPRN